MEKVEILNGLICFRNAGHMLWFYVSMIGFCVSILIYWMQKHNGHFLYVGGWHLVASANATVVIVLLKQESNVFSVDCIWFNFLMFAIYMGLYFIVWRFRQVSTVNNK